MRKSLLLLTCIVLGSLFLAGCGSDASPEPEPEPSGSLVVEIYVDGNLARRFIRVDELSYYESGEDYAVRHGYGVLDDNLNMQADAGEARVYFEFDADTPYVLFDMPNQQ